MSVCVCVCVCVCVRARARTGSPLPAPQDESEREHSVFQMLDMHIISIPNAADLLHAVGRCQDPFRVNEGPPTQVLQALQVLVGVAAQVVQRHQPRPLPRLQRLALNHSLVSGAGVASGQHSWTTGRTVKMMMI